MPAEPGRAAALLRDADAVHLLVSPDADGALAASLLGLALHRAKVPWHASFAPRGAATWPGEAAPGHAVVAVGLPAPPQAPPDPPLVVLDPWFPREAGPGLATAEPSAHAMASTLAFDLARALDPRAPALVALAGLDACGDAEVTLGLRARLAEEACKQGAKPGPVPALGSGALVEALAGCVAPFLPGLTGRARAAARFLESVGIPAGSTAEDLGAEAAERLASALTLHLLSRGAAPGAARLLLTPDLRTSAPGGAARRLAFLASTACGAGRPGLALALGLGDGSAEREVLGLAEARHQRLLEALLKLEGDGGGAGPLRADPDLGSDLAEALAVSLRGGAPVGVLAGPDGLHVAAPGLEPRVLGQAAFEAAVARGGWGGARGQRARLEVPGGRAAEAWADLRARLERVA